MDSIKINVSSPSGIEKLSRVLDEVQRRATARVIDADDVLQALKGIEKRLHVSKSALDGTIARVDVHAQKFPNAYKRKGTPESTFFTAQNVRGKWFVIDVSRCPTASYTRAVVLQLSETTKAAIISACESFAL